MSAAQNIDRQHVEAFFVSLRDTLKAVATPQVRQYMNRRSLCGEGLSHRQWELPFLFLRSGQPVPVAKFCSAVLRSLVIFLSCAVHDVLESSYSDPRLLPTGEER